MKGTAEIVDGSTQLSFKHVLREPCGGNISFLPHTEYFVVFWAQNCCRKPAVFMRRKDKKTFLIKGKGAAWRPSTGSKRSQFHSVDKVSKRNSFGRAGTGGNELALYAG